MFFAYILRSLRDGTYYYGHCANLHQRLSTHNTGRARYTKGHIPYVLHYKEIFGTKKEAAARERFFKSLAGNLWLRAKGIIDSERCRSGFPFWDRTVKGPLKDSSNARGNWHACPLQGVNTEGSLREKVCVLERVPWVLPSSDFTWKGSLL